MKIQAFLFIATLVLFTTLVQDTEGAIAVLPPGKKGLQRKVRTWSQLKSKAWLDTRLGLHVPAPKYIVAHDRAIYNQTELNLSVV